MHAYIYPIYPKMPDQTVNSIYECAFIILNIDTDFLIKLWWILYKKKVVSKYLNCLQIYAYINVYNG